jgi:hypothetical protein
MWAKSCRRSLLAFCMMASLLAAAPAGRTQDKEKDKEEQKEPINVLPFEATEVGINVCAMVACVGSAPFTNQGHSLAIIGTRVLAGKENLPLTKWQFTFDTVFPLNQNVLDLIQDGRPLPDLRFKELKELPLPDRALYIAYNDALHYSASRSTLEMFDKSGEEYQNVFYSHLANDPKRYRGKIITVTGKLIGIQEDPAPAARQREGLKFVYTGYILGPKKGAPPYTVVFTELPAGVLKPTENFNREVTFRGYFLGHVRHPADKEKGRTQKDVISPWIVGKTAVVLPEQKVEPPADGDRAPNSSVILAWTVGAIVGVAVLIALLNAWFRRGDRAVQAKLAAMRDRQQPFNLEPADESETPQDKPPPV